MHNNEQNQSILNESLIAFGDDHHTVRDGCRNTLIIGGTGSGKTSGPINTISISLLANKGRFGGVFTCTKVDDKERALDWCRKAGRLDDVRVISADGKNTLNMLNMSKNFVAKGNSLSVVGNRTIEVSNQLFDNRIHKSGSDPFWDNSVRLFFTCAISLLRMAGVGLSYKLLNDILHSAPKSGEDLESDVFRDKSLCMQCLYHAMEHSENDPELPMVMDYMTNYHVNLDIRTLSNIHASVSAKLYPLTVGLPALILDADESNFGPEELMDGKIWILDFPSATYESAGNVVQGMILYLVQQTLLARNIKENARPVFLVIDECQKFMSSFTSLFVSQNRSSNVLTYLASQSISSIYEKMGGGLEAKYIVEAFLENMSTKIMLSNSEVTSSEYCAKIVGQHYGQRTGVNASTQGGLSGTSLTEDLRYYYLPQEFRRLKTGGPDNGFLVEGIMVQSGRIYSNGLTHKR